jgi:hypothetical protein
MPKITTLSATGVPPDGSGRFRYEVAHIKTTITCKDIKTDAAICGAISGSFAALGMNPATAIFGAFGGIMTQFGCGIAGVGNT